MKAGGTCLLFVVAERNAVLCPIFSWYLLFSYSVCIVKQMIFRTIKKTCDKMKVISHHSANLFYTSFLFEIQSLKTNTSISSWKDCCSRLNKTASASFCLVCRCSGFAGKSSKLEPSEIWNGRTDCHTCVSCFQVFQMSAISRAFGLQLWAVWLTTMICSLSWCFCLDDEILI